MRVAILRGPHKGLVLEHDGTAFLSIRRDRTPLEVLVDRIRRRPPPGPPAMYRVFSRALADDRDRADLYAAEWCIEHEAFRDRCPHAPPSRTRVWARFGPRRNQTALDAGAPGARESKWHLLSNDHQVAEPWLTACDLIVYGPVIEEYRHAVLTPIGMPMCRNCKKRLGLEEQVIQGSRGIMT
jgi:hypothetical protein